MKRMLTWGLALMIGHTALHAGTVNVVDSQNRFALDLYREIAAQPGNQALSPYSIALAFAMTYAGARGETARQMAQTLHVPNNPAVHEAFATLQSMVDNTQRQGVQLNTANAVWIQRDYPIQPAFRETLRTHYRADLMRADFVENADGAIADINRWVAKQSKDKIEQLFSPGSLSPLTRLVLTNAIYFKGRWQSQFDPDQTDSRPFHLANGQAIPVPTMRTTATFSYGKHDGNQVVALPYSGQLLSMWIILPEDGLPSLEEKLDIDYLQALTDSVSPQAVRLDLPRFQAKGDVDLGSVLPELGMTHAFDMRADFAGINGREQDLYIAKAVHKAVVEVNEEGTEAAAATGVVVATRSRPQYAVFQANRPFLYFIRHDETGALLFMGRISDPR